MPADLSIDLDRETDGRWIAEVRAIPGVIVYGESPDAAVARARRLAAEVIADRQGHGEPEPNIYGSNG